jgi:energy-coupling factor transporter ATP-binding protein EcfA2
VTVHGDPAGNPHEAPPAPGATVARVRGLVFAYGDATARALDGIDLEVRAGEVLVLEGPSGGGKSTLLRALAGLVPDFHGGTVAGAVEVDGRDALRQPPAALGGAVGMVFQDPEAQAVMGTVDRDVAFGPQNAGLPAPEIAQRVDEALDAAGAGHLRGRRIDELSSGERQRVAIAGVLARRPRLLLLDEPTSQLDSAAAAALSVTLRRLADQGTAVVVAEHRAERVRPIADRVLAVCCGQVGPPGPDEPAAADRPPVRVVAPPALRAEGIVAGHGARAVLDGASLALAPGRVTALVGPNGSGKTTLLRTLAGLHCPDAGRVMLGDDDVSALPPEDRFPRLGMVPQDPGRHLLTERVGDEIAVALASMGITGDEAAARVAAAAAELGLDDMLHRHPLDLSVGERERVALASILVARPAVLVLDEPTRGMDPARKHALAQVIRAHAARGAAVLVATHDGPFAAAAADEVLEVSSGDAVPTGLPPSALLAA